LLKFKSTESKESYFSKKNSSIISKEPIHCEEEKDDQIMVKRLNALGFSHIMSGPKKIEEGTPSFPDKFKYNYLNKFLEVCFGEFNAIQMSNDHKCDVDREQRRILEYGGRVDRIKCNLFLAYFIVNSGAGTVGPLRVWFRHEDKLGLAMTRSIGDHIARNIGVISKPGILGCLNGLEINIYNIEENDYALLLASDGLLEYMSNQTIADI
jgi:hypothetical protein